MMNELTRRNFIMQGVGIAGVPLPIRKQSIRDTPSGTLVKELAVRIPQLLNEHGVPGLQIAVIKDGRVSWSQGFGLRETATKNPVTTDTIFELASLSKPTFAYAVLRLIDKGIIELDTPLTRYLPDPFMLNDPRLQSITTRMILCHTSGIPHGRQGNKPLSLLFEPGTRFQYSATGFDYLQKAVYKITQQSLERFMRESVLEPFEMSNSNFGWQDRFGLQRALAYNSKGEPGQTFNEKYRTASAQWLEAVTKSNPELSYPSAAAGMYGVADDFASFLIEMVKPRVGISPHLSEKLLKEMLSPQIRITNDVSWGLGWGILHAKADDVLWHWGNWNGLYQHFATILKTERRGVVILTNSGNGLNLCKRLAPMVIGVDIKPIHRFFD